MSSLSTAANSTSSQARGILYAIAAYAGWGMFPAYWKLLKHVPSLAILEHRVIWSALFFSLLLKFRGNLPQLGLLFRRPGRLATVLLSSLLIGSNWGVYIYGVNSGQVLETSLGYFINPLMTLMLGTYFLREKLSPVQWLSVALATAGVINLAYTFQHLPWIAIFLATSFSLYGLVRKTMPVEPLTASTLEALILSLPAAVGLFYIGSSAGASTAFWMTGTPTSLLLILGGVVTALPLIGFTEAGKRLPLSTLGILQYISPSLQFTLAVFAYNEPLERSTLGSFVVIWLALGIYVWDMLSRAKQPRESALKAV